YAYHEKEKIYHYVYINPYTGEVLKVKDLNYDFFTIIIQLHMNLLLPYEIGHQIVGAAVLVFVVSLISGLILWFPASKKGIKQRFSVKWNAQWRRRNYDLHNVFGFYSFLLALIIALTGLVWSYDWFAHSVDWLANGGKLSGETKEPISAISVQKSELPIDRLFAETAEKRPETQLFTVDFPTSDTATFALGFYPSLTTYHNGTYLLFDQYSGQLLKEDSPRTQTAGQRIRAMNYDIHIGKILGLPGQILAFFASLVAASLPVTGFLIWWGRRKKDKKRPKRKIVSFENAKVTHT
nr:PepSY domain-containing protein [Cytophagales bacterium]